MWQLFSADRNEGRRSEVQRIADARPLRGPTQLLRNSNRGGKKSNGEAIVAGVRGRSGGRRQGAGRPSRGPLGGAYLAAVGAQARVIAPTTETPTSDVPAHLRPETAEWYRHVVQTWVLDGHHLRILQLAAETWDMSQSAREVLARDGLTVPTKDGGCKAHPLLTVATSARMQFASFIAQLDLDDAGAPGGSR